VRILELVIENVKRIKAIELKPVGDVVVISGKNGQGKTSVLDSIEWLFAGAKHIQSVPIRKGEKSARIKAKIGDRDVEFIVTRSMREGKPQELIVTTAEGFTPPGGAQGVLDAFLGSLSFDPLGFSRMNAKEQVAELLRVFPIGIDPIELDGMNRTDYAKRTDVNRDAKARRTQATAVTVAPDLPTKPIDEAKLLDLLTDAADGNQIIEQRKAKRADVAREIENATARAVRDRDKAEEIHRRATEQIDELLAAARASEVLAGELKKKLDDAAPLPEPVDISELKAELNAAKATNEAIRTRETKAKLLKDAEAFEAESKRLTEQMEAREQAKREAVAAAKFPVEGLGFGDGIVTLGGVPFDQASASETLKVSVAIGIAANPKLRVMLIRDGSLLDDDSREQIAAMAEDADTQLWIEVARTDEPTGFVIEDGTATVAVPTEAVV